MKNKFKILETGNFYFPIMDKGKKFLVEDTIDIDLDKKYNKLIETVFKMKGSFLFGMLANPIWYACKKDLKKYNNHWFVPIALIKMGNRYTCTIDILRKTK